MFGVDLQLTTEAALLSPNSMDLSNISNYWEELLSSVRKLVATTLHEEQKRSKEQQENKSIGKDHKIGDWVLVRYPKGKAESSASYPNNGMGHNTEVYRRVILM